MARQRQTTKPATRTRPKRATRPRKTGGEFKCPECGRTFTRAAALGAHRRIHGVRGTSNNARSRRGPATSSARRPRRSTTTRNGAIDRDALLRALFPQGIPPSEDVVRAVNAWLDDAERLARLR
jgi:predicted RNA-binding Zn-ribbon protein involved in translation (DUF1610 family)